MSKKPFRKQSPLKIVNESFGSKKELASKLAAILEPGEGEDKEQLAARLAHVANAKLLNLHELAKKVEAHGGREGLTKKVAEAEKKANDKDFVAALSKRSLGWLVDRVENKA